MKQCHDLKKFAAKTAELNAKWILKEKKSLPDEIESCFLWSDQGRLEILGAVITGSGSREEIIHGEIPKTTLPLEDEPDLLLEAFRAKHKIKDEKLDWGDYFKLPECLYRMEMILAARESLNMARKKGIRIAPTARAGILIEDEDYSEPAPFARSAKKALSKMDGRIAGELLGLYYLDPRAAMAEINKFAKERE